MSAARRGVEMADLLARAEAVGVSVVLATAIALALLVSYTPTGSGPSGEAAATADAGPPPVARLAREAPGFELDSLGGDRVSLTGHRGRPVVLNFWATWCPPCRAELPEFEAVHRARPDAAIFAVDVQESPDLVARFRDDLGLSLPILLDADGSTWARYQSRGLPTTYVIDGRGIVRDVHVGPLTRDLLTRRLDMAGAGNP